MPTGGQLSQPQSPKHSTQPTPSTSIANVETNLALPALSSPVLGAMAARPPQEKPSLTAGNLLQLQRGAGNRAVSRLLQAAPAPPTVGIQGQSSGLQQSLHSPTLAHPIQRKVAVGPANDRFEREADSVAKQVATTLAAPAFAHKGPRNKARKQDEAGEAIAPRLTPAAAKPMVAQRALHPIIQRKVFFEVDELTQKPVTDLEIMKVNVGERPPFLKGRWKTLDKTSGKGKTHDYRHIVSFDLIKKALQHVLKYKTVTEAAQWLADGKHWIDQANAHKDIITGDLLKTVQGTQMAADNWLKNANSYENNLWRGPRKENRQKGINSVIAKDAIRESWINGTPLGQIDQIQEIRAFDSTAGSPMPFEDDQGLQFQSFSDYCSRISGHRIKSRLQDMGISFKAMEGTKLHITLKNAAPVDVSAILLSGNNIFRVGRGYQLASVARSLDHAKFYDSQLDHPKASTTPLKTVRDSLKMYDAQDMPSTVVDIAVSGTKYNMQMARLDDAFSPSGDAGGTLSDPHLESSIQRATQGGAPLQDKVRAPLENAFGANFADVRIHADSAADRLSRSVNAKAFTTGRDIFFRQGYYQPQQVGGRELLAHELTHVIQQKGSAANPGVLQRKVHFDLREKRNLLHHQPPQDNAFLKWKIKHVQISGRPPILTSRQDKSRNKGQDYRHIVSFDLIAKALRKTLKGMTIGEAAQWLGNAKNWIDQEHVDKDMLDGNYLNSIQGIQAAADNWIKNANSFKANLWPGDSSENREKGAAGVSNKKKIKKHWRGGQVADTNDGGFLVSTSNSGALIPFENGSGEQTDALPMRTLPDATVYKALSGAKLFHMRMHMAQVELGNAVYVDSGLVYKVSRSFKEPKQISGFQNEHLRAQLDPPFLHDQQGAVESLGIRGKDGQRKSVVAVALGQSPGKYVEQNQLRQISQPLFTQEERAIQKEIEQRKIPLLKFVTYRAGNRKFDQEVWQQLGLTQVDLENHITTNILPACKTAGDVSKLLQKTWDRLNAASDAALEMQEIASFISHKSYKRDPSDDIAGFRKIVCQLAREGALAQNSKALWEKVNSVIVMPRPTYHRYPPRQQPPQQMGHGYDSPQIHSPSSPSSQSGPSQDNDTSQQKRKRTESMEKKQEGKEKKPFVSKSDLSSHTPQHDMPPKQIGDLSQQLGTLLQSLQNSGMFSFPPQQHMQQHTQQQTTTTTTSFNQGFNNPFQQTTPTPPPFTGFTLPPQSTNTFGNQSQQQGFNFQPYQQPVSWIGRKANIIENFQVAGWGEVIQEEGQYVMLYLHLNNGYQGKQTFSKDSWNLHWLKG